MAFVALALLGGCSKSGGNEAEQVVTKSELSIGLPIGISRTAVDAEGRASWVEGDTFALWAENATGGYIYNAVPFQMMYYWHSLQEAVFTSNANSLAEGIYTYYAVSPTPESTNALKATYTIPAEYIRGGYVSIKGDMQQVQHYTVNVVGAPEGQGGVNFLGKEYGHEDVIDASQYFSADDVTPIQIEGYISSASLDATTKVLTVTYKAIQAYRNISSLSELRNDMAYHIKAKSGEGYLAWNPTITNTYVSLRGVTNSSYNKFPSNEDIVNIYKEEVSPFDSTVIWQILKEGDEYYLYQPANQSYVTRNGRDYVFTVNKTALDKIRDNGDGTFSFHAGGGYSESSTYFACIVTNEASCAVRNWTWNDHGSVMYIIENPNVEVTDLVTSIQDITAGDAATIQQGIYNMQGQKLHALPKEGVFIVNGKKKVVRK